MTDRMLTTDQVAERLNLDVHQVRWLIRNDRLSAYKVGHRTWRIAESDLDAFLAQAYTGGPDHD